MKWKLFLAGSLLLAAVVSPLPAALHAQSQTAPKAAVQIGNKHRADVRSSQHSQDEGQRIFEQNCSRCHNAPEGFSPNISGTIVRHMRIRASLSQHDEQELLRFFNP